MAQLNALIEQIEERIEGLEELKTTLVSDVVTGKIDVRDVEIPEYEFVDRTSTLIRIAMTIRTIPKNRRNDYGFYQHQRRRAGGLNRKVAC